MKKAKKIGICAHLAMKKNLLDGQVIKSKTLLEAMVSRYGAMETAYCDTSNWHNRPLYLFFQCVYLARNCKNIIILPAQNGVKVFPLLFVLLKKVFGFKLHYVVVGGWLPELISNKKWLLYWLRKIDCIYVELTSLKLDLKKIGLSNVYEMIAHDYRAFPILLKEEMPSNKVWENKFCFFSRIVKEKGVEYAIDAIKETCISKQLELHLDLYGQVDIKYKNRFEELCRENSAFITYKGSISFGKSIDILKNYTALLFPTYYDGEGLAGIFIDAMAAGIPVIASDWHANKEIIKDGYNGLIVPTHNLSELQDAIIKLVENNELVLELKKNCLHEVEKYEPSNALQVIFDQLR